MDTEQSNTLQDMTRESITEKEKEEEELLGEEYAYESNHYDVVRLLEQMSATQLAEVFGDVDKRVVNVIREIIK